jgi:hypothetical protein
MNGVHARESFPISPHSKECEAFGQSLSRIITKLKDMKLEWNTIECVGRRSKKEHKKIRSTVVIGMSELPANQDELEKEIQSVMVKQKLPVEMVIGRLVEESHFKFNDLQRPLVCGGSCGVIGRSGSGTIGGFVQIDGDPDPNAIYAVTNHHVISGDSQSIPWANHEKVAAHLGIPEDIQLRLEEGGLGRLGRKEIFRLLELFHLFSAR